MTSDQVIKTDVWHNEKCFFVSTIERDSSAMYGGRYNETIVWEFDWETKKRGELLYMGSGPTGSIKTHQKIVERIYETGDPEEKEGEEI